MKTKAEHYDINHSKTFCDRLLSYGSEKKQMGPNQA